MSQHGQYTITGFLEVRTLVDNAGVVVAPTLGAIDLIGGNNITTHGFPGISTMVIDLTGTTDHCVQIGNIGGSLTSIAAATNGQILLGTTGADPSFGNLGVGNGIAKVEGAGALAIAGIDAGEAQVGVVELATDAETIAGAVTVPVNTAIRPTALKAKLGVQTQYGLPIGNTDALAIQWTAVPTDGQLLIGATGATPALATLTAGANIGVANAANSITLKVAGTTSHAVQLGNATGDLTSTAVGLQGEVFVGGGAAADAKWLAASGVLDKILMSTAAGDPKWSTSTYPDTIAIGSILHASAANTVDALAVGATGTILTGVTGAAPAWSAALTDGQLVIGSTGNAPVLSTLTAGTNIGVTSAAGSITIKVAGTTDHTVQVGNATGDLTSLAVGATGEIIIGNTGANPSWSSSPNITGTVTAATVRTGDPATVAAIMSLNASTITLDGTGANVGLTVTPKGTGGLTLTTGSVTISSGNLNLPTSTATIGIINLNATRWLHSYGDTSNIFCGYQAGNLTFNTTYNSNNAAFGAASLKSLAGANAGEGSYNTACGTDSAYDVTSGSYNTCVGYKAGYSSFTTGNYNTIIGSSSGESLATSDSSNIILGHGITGTGGQSNILVIGKGTGTGNGELNKSFIHGIYGRTTTSATTAAVLVSNTGQLGTITSSIRYKENIKDMDDESSFIFKLRPVTFNYKENHDGIRHYGLIAEEVNEIEPRLVARNKDGEIESVMYHDFPSILINEMIKMQKKIVQLTERVSALEKGVN